MPSGRAPKPTLAVVREGNPGHRPIRDSVVLPPSPLTEPNWVALLGDEAASIAADLWKQLTPTLTRSVGLVGEQQFALEDYCLGVARIKQGERALSREGVIVQSQRADRGMVRNPWTTVLNQYRPHVRSLAAELGLTPAAATRLQRPPMSGDDDDDPFD